MNDIFEKKLHLLSQQTFDAQLSELDDDILNRLKKSRQLALNSVKQTTLENKKIEIHFPNWLSFASSATAFASVALITASLWMHTDFKMQSITTPLDDIALLSSADELDFYENLDFYIWLEEEENAS